MSRRTLGLEAAAAMALLASLPSTREFFTPVRTDRRNGPADAPATYREPKRKAQWKSETYGRRQK